MMRQLKTRREMRRNVLAACAAVCLLVVPTVAPGQSRPPVATVGSQLAALLAQFPGGGPALRAAIARAVEADPSLADAIVAIAKKASPAQKLAIGMGLADAADYFAKCGLDWCRGAEARIRTAMNSADEDTRIGFIQGSAPTLVQGIPGFNNAGVMTNGCSHVVSPSGPGSSGQC
jgi:hypothetical protein